MSLEEKDAHSSRIIGPLHLLVWVVLGLIVWAIPAGAGGAWFAALSEDDKKAVNGAACALTTGPIATAVLMVPNLLMAQRFVDFGAWPYWCCSAFQRPRQLQEGSAAGFVAVRAPRRAEPRSI